MAQNTQDRIREQAYYLWVNDGCQEGREMDYWLAAERNVTGKKKKPTATKKALSVVSSTPKKKAATPRKAVTSASSAAKK